MCVCARARLGTQDPKKFREEKANKYIGYQVAHMSVSFFIITFLLVVVIAILAPIVLSAARVMDDGSFFNFLISTVLRLVPGIALPLVGTLVFQLVCNRIFFFQQSKHVAKSTWLKNPVMYGLFDYNLLYTNAFVGLTVCIGRFAILFIFFVLFLARLDKTTMPGPRGGFLNIDAGFATYIAMLRLDHRYNNPIFLVFGDAMLEKLNATRIKTVLRNARRTHANLCFAKELQAARDAGESLAELLRMVRQHRVRLWARRIVEIERDNHERRCIIVRNRWQLLLRCHQQPALTRWRADKQLRTDLMDGSRQPKSDQAAAAPAAASPNGNDAPLSAVLGSDGERQPAKLRRQSTKGMSAADSLTPEQKSTLRAELQSLQRKLAPLADLQATDFAEALAHSLL